MILYANLHMNILATSPTVRSGDSAVLCIISMVMRCLQSRQGSRVRVLICRQIVWE